MKRTVELDTLKIAERLSVESRKVRLAALATGGLDGEDAGPIEFLLFEIEEEIDSIAETVHPHKPEEEIPAVKRPAVAKLARIREASGEGSAA